MNKNYTLKEIAKELNVSRATIDRVIHNRGDIGEETTKRVKEFLEKVDYKPNRVGRSLAKRLQKNIYVIFHNSQNEFFESVKRGIAAAENEIKDFGFNVITLAVNSDSTKQMEIINDAIEKDADAIAISPYEPEKFANFIDEIVGKGIPVVTFNNDVVNSTRLCYIGTNYYKSGRTAGEVLGKFVKAGKIAILSKSSYWHSQQRIMGFREAIDTFQDISVLGPYRNFTDEESAYLTARTVIESESYLKGIFVLDNDKGIISGVSKAIKEYGNRNIDVVTLDLNSECVSAIKNGLVTATICQDPFTQGYHSVKVLFNYLFDNRKPKTSVYMTKLDVIFKENLDNYDIKREMLSL